VIPFIYPFQNAGNWTVQRATVCGHAAWACSMSMGMQNEHGHAAWAWAWTCNMDRDM
jgi:hypothetical protein